MLLFDFQRKLLVAILVNSRYNIQMLPNEQTFHSDVISNTFNNSSNKLMVIGYLVIKLHI